MAKDERFEFHLIGGDTCATNLPANVQVHPFLSDRKTLLARIREFDVLLHIPSHEPWGLVINEAQACGLACIVSDNVGAVECVEGAGLIIANDENLNTRVIDALFLYARDTQLLQNHRVEAIKRAHYYSYEQLISKMTELLS